MASATTGIKDLHPIFKAKCTSLLFPISFPILVLFFSWLDLFIESDSKLVLCRIFTSAVALVFFISITNFTLKCSISYRKIVDCSVWNEALHNSGQSMCLVSCPKRPWLEMSYWINPELLRILPYTSCYCLSLLCLVLAFSISVTEECSITFSKDKPVLGRILRQLPRSCSPVYIL